MDDAVATQSRVHDLEGRVSRMEAGIESLTASMAELRDFARQEATARRASFDELVNRLDVKTKPQHSLVLQMIAVGLTIAGMLGAAVGLWISRTETENFRWRTDLATRIETRSSHVDDRIDRFDESIQREMRLLDEAIQREMRTLDQHLALRVTALEKANDDMIAWRRTRDAASIRSNTEQGERISSLQHRLEALIATVSQSSEANAKKLADRQEWMRHHERLMGSILEQLKTLQQK